MVSTLRREELSSFKEQGVNVVNKVGLQSTTGSGVHPEREPVKTMKQLGLAVTLVAIKAMSRVVEAQQRVKTLLQGYRLHRPKR